MKTMTPKLGQDGFEVYVLGDEDGGYEKEGMWCDSVEEAAAIVRACEHFDALLAAARQLVLSQELYADQDAISELIRVFCAIDKDTP